MSLSWFKKLVKMPKLQNKQFIFEICNSNRVFSIKCHLYLPTLKQVEQIPPFEANEKIQDMSNSTEVVQSHLSTVSEFILDNSISLTESDSIQFKYLKEEKSKNTTIADRIINKTNKLTMTISAFANQSGGLVLYGISNDGIVKGQRLTENDKSEIETKVAKAISKMIWLQKAMEKGKDWNIEFIPVKDNENSEVASLFIIKISIKALPGGVFVQQPESYHIGLNKKVEQMSFEVWSSRVIFGVKPVKVPASLSCVKWSSTTSQRKYFTVIFELNELQNQANYEKFNEIAKKIKKECAGTATELFVIAIESVVAYKRGMMKKAEEIVEEMEASLKSRGDIDDHKILEFRMLYAKSAIARAKGENKSSYEYAKEAQQVAVLIPPGVLTAWFFNHVAIVEKFLSQQQREEENIEMEKSALNHYIKALQYAKSSNVEQEFTRMIADLEQRVHIFRAITILGNFATGANLPEVTPSNIKGAEEDLTCYERLVIQGFIPSNYRRTYSLFARCDLRFAQWYQQQINQRRQRQQQQQQQRLGCSIVCKTPDLLKEAYKLALEARQLSKQCCFEELTMYANYRIGKITEMMVKLNFVMTLSKRRSKMSN